MKNIYKQINNAPDIYLLQDQKKLALSAQQENDLFNNKPYNLSDNSQRRKYASRSIKTSYLLHIVIPICLEMTKYQKIVRF